MGIVSVWKMVEKRAVFGRSNSFRILVVGRCERKRGRKKERKKERIKKDKS